MPSNLAELGQIVLMRAQSRLEIASQNVANIATPGYKRGLSFATTLEQAGAPPEIDHASGALTQTGRALDLALQGTGYFSLRSDHGLVYTRGGQFETAADGRVVSAEGLAVQTTDGTDLVLPEGIVEFLSDGTVSLNGAPIAKISVRDLSSEGELTPLSGSLFAASEEFMTDVANPSLVSGRLESSNVDLSQEMVDMLKASREAEIGARILQTYDSLVGQAASTFGRAAK